MESGRVLLSFCTVSMAPREAMLLKSFMRILEDRTAQRWLFKPRHAEREQQEADLIFVGDDGGEMPANPQQAPNGRRLRMGVSSLDLSVQLNWPLRPDELEHELNRMGSTLVRARTAPHLHGGLTLASLSAGEKNLATTQSTHLWRPVAKGSTLSEFAPASDNGFADTAPAGLDDISLASSGSGAQVSAPSAQPPQPKIALDDELRLMRWPLASLINTPAKLKLAALMTGATSTLSNLQKTSGQSLSACSEFLEGMHRMGFVSVVLVEPRRFVEDADQQAPFELPDMTSKLPAAPEKAHSAPVAAPSLFARIRARLGISKIH